MGGLMHWEIENAALRERIAKLEKQEELLKRQLKLEKNFQSDDLRAARQEAEDWFNMATQQIHDPEAVRKELNRLWKLERNVIAYAAAQVPEGVALQ